MLWAIRSLPEGTHRILQLLNHPALPHLACDFTLAKTPAKMRAFFAVRGQTRSRSRTLLLTAFLSCAAETAGCAPEPAQG